MKKYLVPILCALPFVGIVLWFVAGKDINNLATIGLVLACPLSHLFFMGHKDNNNKKKHSKDVS